MADRFPVDAKTFLIPLQSDGQPRLEWKSAAFLATGLGLAGVDWVTNTSAHVGNWWIFHAVTDCVVASVLYKDDSSAFPAGVTIKAGDRIFGRIRSLTLTSGTGELYRASINP